MGTLLKCKLCGGDVTLNSNMTLGTCQYCGNTITLPKITEEQRIDAFNRGNYYRRIGEFDKALSVYESIIHEDNTDAEAHWCCALCRFGIEYVEDPSTMDYVPTCHRMSFDSFLEDIDYLAAVEHSEGSTRRQYQKDAMRIAEVQKGILATSQNEEPFDVFICYKETDESGRRTLDSKLAQDIYYQLVDAGLKVFFSRITLEDHVGTEYEPYIFAALNSAKVMVVVGTKKEYLDAVWVKNEWSRYLLLMKKDRNRVLLPCYKGMNPYDMPDALSALQSYDISNIGFIQDLLRGIKKIINKESKKSEDQSVIVHNVSGNAETMAKRGFQSLEDQDWEKANECFENALNIDPEYSETHLGKAFLEFKCSDENDFINYFKTSIEKRDEIEKCVIPIVPDEKLEEIVNKYVVPGYLSQEEITKRLDSADRFDSIVNSLRKKYEQISEYYRNDKHMARAIRYANGTTKKRIEKISNETLGLAKRKLEEAEAAEEIKRKEIEDRNTAKLNLILSELHDSYQEATSHRESDYQKCCADMEIAETSSDYDSLSTKFGKMGDYLDARKRSQECAKKSEKIKSAKSRKKIIIIVTIVAALTLIIGALAYLIPNVFIPSSKYNQAMNCYDAHNYRDAKVLFDELADYKSSKAMSLDCVYKSAENYERDKEYDKAISLWSSISGYGDSLTRVLGAHYNRAIDFKNNKEYEQAIESFEKAQDYQDAVSQIQQCYDLIYGPTYNNACEKITKEEYGEAYELFATILNYKDSEELYKKSAYDYAQQLIHSKEYEKAVTVLEYAYKEDKDTGEKQDNSKLIDEATKFKNQGLFDKTIDTLNKIDFESLSEYQKNEVISLCNTCKVGLKNKNDTTKLDDIGSIIHACEKAKPISEYRINDEKANVLRNTALLRSAIQLSENGDVVDAYKTIERMDKGASNFSKDSALKKIYFDYGKKLCSDKKFDEASSAFKEAEDYPEAESMYTDAEYNYAIQLIARDEYTEAISRLKNILDYKDSKEKLKEAKFGYANQKKSNTDLTTYDYLKELKDAKYKGAKELYDDLYAWNVTVTAVNSDKNSSKNMTSISKYDPIYFHYQVKGGPPSGTTQISTKAFFPNGTSDSKRKLENRSYRGDTGWVGWQNGIWETPSNAPGGTLTLKFYDEEGNQIGEGSVNTTS